MYERIHGWSTIKYSKYCAIEINNTIYYSNYRIFHCYLRNAPKSTNQHNKLMGDMSQTLLKLIQEIMTGMQLICVFQGGINNLHWLKRWTLPSPETWDYVWQAPWSVLLFSVYIIELDPSSKYCNKYGVVYDQIHACSTIKYSNYCAILGDLMSYTKRQITPN